MTPAKLSHAKAEARMIERGLAARGGSPGWTETPATVGDFPASSAGEDAPPSADYLRHGRLAHSISEQAQRRFQKVEGSPFLVAAWLETVMVHYTADAELLQRQIPFELDLFRKQAYVSVVAFRMENLRFGLSGRRSARLLDALAANAFLNLRTYVRHENETGIYFLAEWLPKRLCIPPGRIFFGLPYRYGRIEYDDTREDGIVRGRVEACGGRGAFAYRGKLDRNVALATSGPGSLDEFLLERYTAFTKFGPLNRFFRVWHPPWSQAPVDLRVKDDSLLRASGKWFETAQCAGAHFSPGFREVWMGRPRFLSRAFGPTVPLANAISPEGARA